MSDRNDQDPLLPLFAYSGEERRQDKAVSDIFEQAAQRLCQIMPSGPQRSVSLHWLLVAKASAMLAQLFENPYRPGQDNPVVSERPPEAPRADEL